VFRFSAVAQKLDAAKQAALNVERYEAGIVEKYLATDLYRSKDKSRTQISFNDLSLSENLNYIKFNLKSSHEAFSIYDITKQKFPNFPEIPAAII